MPGSCRVDATVDRDLAPLAPTKYCVLGPLVGDGEPATDDRRERRRQESGTAQPEQTARGPGCVAKLLGVDRRVDHAASRWLGLVALGPGAQPGRAGRGAGRLRRRRPSAPRRVGRRLVDHVAHQHRHVVGAARLERERGQLGCGRLGRADARAARSMRSWDTKPVRPSLQISSRSPASTSYVDRSGSLSCRPSSTLSSRDRCEWTLASASVIRPSSIRLWTQRVVAGDRAAARRRGAGSRASRRGGPPRSGCRRRAPP